MVYKKFSRSLYEENDEIAKKVACEYLLSTNTFRLITDIKSQKEQFKLYDFEILYIKENKIVRVEAERKMVWGKRGMWQGYRTIDVPYRKKDSISDIFIMVNKHLDTIAIADMKKVLSSPITCKNTIHTQNEEFFNCPLNIFQFRFFNNNKWNII